MTLRRNTAREGSPIDKKTEKMVEVRVFLPRTIVRRVDKKKGILGNTRSEICRHIIINSLTKSTGG